ncbi:hypothetical protein ACFT39_25050 [[Kitasatospora] papulosa]|uniref:hypothetical protein n=1 Tax=Streptomyces TaxID=1883 RepID=UPI0002C6971A|nr:MULTISPECIES: hypothetical protein [Streptomyces]AGJ59433.1 hypothetical protein F750_7009 [Streptomyces sp. PAMC 26508]RAS24359.1 hypothetical protein BCL80_11435 [Streptomyces avidinii]WJY35374.1 hypothetical protein QTO28_31945 [Streptomyces sp. P9-2B-1]WSK26408.1 hypothetical protein OG483_00425 [[Kitasatospora] papulosa]
MRRLLERLRRSYEHVTPWLTRCARGEEDVEVVGVANVAACHMVLRLLLEAVF